MREFIRDGAGDSTRFLTSCEPVTHSTGPIGHVLSAVAALDNPIIVNMQFFCGCDITLPQWRLVLGDNPTMLYLEKPQASAHFFAYTELDDHHLIGGEVIALTPSFQQG